MENLVKETTTYGDNPNTVKESKTNVETMNWETNIVSTPVEAREYPVIPQEKDYMKSKKEYLEKMNKNFQDALKNLDNKSEEEVDKIDKDLDTEIENLINEKVEADHSFTLDELSEEDKKLLTEEEIKVYNTGRLIQMDEVQGNKSLNLLGIADDIGLTEEEKILLSSEDIKIKKEAEESIRSRLILEGLGVAAKLEQDKFKVKADKIMKTTYPVTIINQYFKLNAKRFEVTEESLKEDKDIEEKAKSYYYTVGIKKMLDMAKDPLFLSRLKKQCSDKRYKRHIEDIDFFIGKAIGNNMQARNSAVNSVKKLDENIRKIFFKHFMMKIWKLDEDNNYAISRAYGYALSEIARKSDIRSNDMIEIYFYNANIGVLTMMGSKDSYKDLIGDAALFYSYVYDFINLIYEYFKKEENK